jgi:hypothetical protein
MSAFSNSLIGAECVIFMASFLPTTATLQAAFS